MQFGMSVVSSAVDDGSKFIGVCARSGLRFVRLVIEKDATAAIKAIVESGVQAALSICRVDHTGVAIAVAALKDDTAFSQMLKMYEECAGLPVDRSLGVILPEGLHHLIRIGRSKRPGLVVSQLVDRVNAIAAVIRKAGHKVVLSSRAEDLAAKTWQGVDHDIVEVEMMMSPQLHADEGFLSILKDVGKPFWFSKAGVVGGYGVPADQLRYIRKLNQLRTDAMYAFLWSEPAQERWSWSVDGKVLVDVVSEIVSAGRDRRMTGDPVISGWKQRLRAESFSTSKMS